jgi:hypothetical protein
MSAVRKGKLGMEFAEKLITDKVELDKAREMILDAIATRSEETPTEHHHLERGETTATRTPTSSRRSRISTRRTMAASSARSACSTSPRSRSSAAG